MHAPDHQRNAPGHGRVGLIRGILVIVTAALIGGFMVARGLDPDRRGGEEVAAGDQAAVGNDELSDVLGSEASGGTGEAATADTLADGTPADGSAVGDTTVTTGATTDGAAVTTTGDGAAVADPAGPEVRVPADVNVLVLNAAGAKGVAGRGSEILQLAGYEVLAPKNADFLGPSKVLFTEGFDVEAQAVAEVFSADPAAVVAPLDPANLPIADTRNADIIVVVGEDGLIDV